MADFPFGSLISAGASLLGGVLGGEGTRKANENVSDAAANSLAFQKEIAAHGVRWKALDVMDAYNATGIHPLALLGVNPASGSVSLPNFQGGSALGEGISHAGQEIGRAVDATAAEKMRLAHQARLDALTVERMGLENQALKDKIASDRARMLQVGPSMPTVRQRYLIDGQGQAKSIGDAASAFVKDNPLKRVRPGELGYNEPAAVTDVGYTKTGIPGELHVVPSEDAMKRMSNDFLGMLSWNIRNRLYPAFGANFAPPFKAPEGNTWAYNPLTQSYYLKGSGKYVPKDKLPPGYDWKYDRWRDNYYPGRR